MDTFVLAFFWGAICSANAQLWLFWRGQGASAQSLTIAAIFFAGAFLAVPMSSFGAWLLLRNARLSALYAFYLAALLAMTVATTAALFTLPQYVYYAQWHAPALSEMWMWQFAFTWVGAFYQFAVMALTFYFPFAFAGLFAIAWALARWRVERAEKP